MDSAKAPTKLPRVKVPVSVTLAHTRQSLGEVLQWKLGTILRLDKPCGAPLELCVGNRPMASGEAVRVGERIGIRIQKIAAPERK